MALLLLLVTRLTVIEAHFNCADLSRRNKVKAEGATVLPRTVLDRFLAHNQCEITQQNESVLNSYNNRFFRTFSI